MSTETTATVTVTTKIAAPAWEVVNRYDSSVRVDLFNATFTVRRSCAGCGQAATLVARRPGDEAGAFDVPWCSRACRIRDLGIEQPVASVRATRGRRVSA